ncbi:MAG: PAS domain S-box protein, partial [Planctomycetota bacterium]|nr:PAS domain S-box protein [Planctomycetota bacterium]
FKQQELMGKDWFVRLVAKDQQDDARGWFLSDEQDAPGIGRCFQIITRLEVVRDIEWYRKVLLDADGKPEGVLCVGHDISELKKANEQLQDAMDKIKTLKGFLPICCSCKKIRDDKGYWNKLEDYISRHSDASFTHGICPDCMEKLYPEISSKKKKKN